MNVLASLTILGLLILFHEAGHFLAAKFQGIRVNGFSIGFGPALIKKDINGVTYALRALPLGGFVSFPDDDERPAHSLDGKIVVVISFNIPRKLCSPVIVPRFGDASLWA